MKRINRFIGGATITAERTNASGSDSASPSRFSGVATHPFGVAPVQEHRTDARQLRSVRELQSYAMRFKATQTQPTDPIIGTLEVLDFADDYAMYKGLDPEDIGELNRYVDDLHILKNALTERIRKGEE